MRPSSSRIAAQIPVIVLRHPAVSSRPYLPSRMSMSWTSAPIATYRREVRIDFGVIESDSQSNLLTGYVEKPSFDYRVSMGIYCFDAKVLDGLQPDTYCDFPDLIKRLLAAGQRVASYPFDGYWLDMGRPDDYATAIDEFELRRAEFLPSEVAR